LDLLIKGELQKELRDSILAHRLSTEPALATAAQAADAVAQGADGRARRGAVAGVHAGQNGANCVSCLLSQRSGI